MPVIGVKMLVFGVVSIKNGGFIEKSTVFYQNSSFCLFVRKKYLSCVYLFK
jgi:hypothetical protein